MCHVWLTLEQHGLELCGSIYTWSPCGHKESETEQLTLQGFPGGSDSKESVCNTGDLDSIAGWKDPLKKGMATHPSILAWRILWTEEPGRLQSMGLQSVELN